MPELKLEDLQSQVSDLKKALDLSGVTGVLTQDEVDTAIQDVLDHQNPLRMNIPRRNGAGESYLLNRKTAQPGPGGFVNDTEEPTPVSFTRGRVTFPYKTILRRGKVTKFAQSVGASYKDLLANEIADTTLLVRDDEEYALINGSVAGNPKEFDGLRIQSPAGQTISAGPGALSLALLDQAIDKVLGRPNMMIMSKRSRRKLWALLQQNQRFVDSVEVTGGFRVTAYAPDIGIFYSQWIADNQGGGTESDLFVIDSQHVFVPWLENFGMVPLAKTSSQFDEFDVRGVETLVVANPERAIARIEEITP